jgi:hypothetical protein
MTEIDANIVSVFENVLTHHELDVCTNLLSRPAWSFGHYSQSSPVATPFWNMSLDGDTFFTNELFSRIQLLTGKKYTLLRVYANGQTFGQDGTYHLDDIREQTYTFCLFMNKQITEDTVDNIGGEFIFKIPTSSTKTVDTHVNKITRVVVEPFYNRGVLFKADIFHKGLAFNRYNKGLRISIAWKLQLII